MGDSGSLKELMRLDAIIRDLQKENTILKMRVSSLLAELARAKFEGEVECDSSD